MENFQRLHRLTKVLHDYVVEFPEKEEKRAEYIQTIQEKLDEREEFLKHYKNPTESLSKEQVDELMKWSEEISRHIAIYRDKIKEDALSLDTQRRMVKKYDPPRGFTFDGSFYDKKR